VSSFSLPSLLLFVQGWTPNFVPAVLDRSIHDELVPVSGAEAMATARLLAAKEGLLVGTSAGGTVAAALKVANKAEKGTVILAMMPDTAERYLSTPLFADISGEGDKEEELK
jgi:cysteine synthase